MHPDIWSRHAAWYLMKEYVHGLTSLLYIQPTPRFSLPLPTLIPLFLTLIAYYNNIGTLFY